MYNFKVSATSISKGSCKLLSSSGAKVAEFSSFCVFNTTCVNQKAVLEIKLYAMFKKCGSDNAAFIERYLQVEIRA